MIVATEPLKSAADERVFDLKLPHGRQPLKMLEVGDTAVPHVPEKEHETGIDHYFLCDLALKLANTVPHFTTEWASEQLCLPMQLVDDLLWDLKDDKMVEILGENGPFSYRYAATGRGRDHAKQLMQLCGYVGAAPVSLEAYTALLDWQLAQRDKVTAEAVQDSLAWLELTEDASRVSELAVSSGRSLFLFGPAGNGKTSMAKSVHDAIRGDIWIPHALHIDGNIIRVFDPQTHVRGRIDLPEGTKLDRRWVYVERPFVIAGGEMTLEELDLAYSEGHKFYEAPLHFKANGGTFVLDDFGRQRVDPFELLNRWIVPLENRVDYLTLHTGQKLEMPFRMMLVVSTNLTVAEIADPAFLRRMGYRLKLEAPEPERYARIFERYAEREGVEVEEGLLEAILARYAEDGRELRASEPRDLIERCRDICTLHNRKFEVTKELMSLAWTGYFGNMDYGVEGST